MGWTMVHGPFAIEPWTIVHGPWSMVHRPWSMDHGPWAMGHGPWTMLNGTWTMVNGPVHGPPCTMDHGQRPWTIESLMLKVKIIISRRLPGLVARRIMSW